MEVIEESHLDHGISEDQLDWLLEKFSDKEGFFIETVELPADLGTAPCGLHGPVMGDDPVSDEDVEYRKRGDREWESRLVDRPAHEVRTVSVIAGPHEDISCALYTAFGGPVVPQEPGDPECKDVEASNEFWAKHALSMNQ